jgi:hypothetical protein
MNVPDKVRKDLKRRMWEIADRIGWMNLSTSAKASYYENWTNDPKIGGLLARYISKGQVRVYLKDTILKDYPRTRMSDAKRPLGVLNIPWTIGIAETYIKPHGRRLIDGRVICWGRADDWKTILTALHERAYSQDMWWPFAAIFTQAVGRYHDTHVRTMINDAATKLGIKKVIWLED